MVSRTQIEAHVSTTLECGADEAPQVCCGSHAVPPAHGMDRVSTHSHRHDRAVWVMSGRVRPMSDGMSVWP